MDLQLIQKKRENDAIKVVIKYIINKLIKFIFK